MIRRFMELTFFAAMVFAVARLWNVEMVGAAVIAASAFAGAGILSASTWTKKPDDRQTARNPSAADALRAEQMIEALVMPILTVDRRLAVRHANNPAKTMFDGIERGVALARWFRDPDMLSSLSRMVRERVDVSFTFTLRGAEDRLFAVHARPIPEADGLFAIFFEDQTAMHKLDRMRSDFIANASHELRTPLAAISGFLETLKGPARDDAKNRDRFVDIMLGQSARMSRLINDLMSLSTLESQAVPLSLDSVDLGEVSETATAALTPLAATRGVELVNQMPVGRHFVRGEADKLNQVVQNLIENACRYAASGKRVEIGLPDDLRPGETGVAVRDFGPGIEAEHIPRLTERFYRVSVANSREQQGTGLGLSIVRHIVLRHRGRLRIQSEVGRGSTFAVIVPKIEKS